MIVQAEVDENGFVKVNDPQWRGEKIVLSLPIQEDSEDANETDWEAIKAIVKQSKSLAIRRRSYEEIIRDLHELRGQ